MKLLAGLGNFEKKYEKSRHNVGFMAVDNFATGEGLKWKLNPDLMCSIAKTGDYVLIKPNTLMNRSGESVLAVCRYFKIDFKDVLIVYDEIDLPFGKIRLAFNGLSAGHHGVDSVIAALGSVDFGRLRIGVGKPESEHIEISDYVLSDFTKEETKDLKELLSRSSEALRSYLDDGIEATMNRFN